MPKNIRKFINNFNFPNPEWDDLPEGFFRVDKSNLSKQEQSLHSAILAAWVVDRSGELKQQIIEIGINNRLLSSLYLAGKIAFYLLIFTLITGNLINYFLIEVYHSIL